MKEQILKILRGALIASIGAGLTYVTKDIGNLPMQFTVDSTVYDLTPIVVALWSVIVNILRKALGL